MTAEGLEGWLPGHQRGRRQRISRLSHALRLATREDLGRPRLVSVRG